MQIVRTRKTVRCPVCNKDHGCALLSDGKVLCLRVSPGTVPRGYKIVSQLNNGMGYLCVPDSSERDINPSPLSLSKVDKPANPNLICSARNVEIQKLLSQLTLSTADKNSLLNRGLSLVEIEAGLFRSVVKFQHLMRPVSTNLAGVDATGYKLTNIEDGIICPVWNYKQELVAWQLRTDNPNRKYVWASSRCKSGNQNTVHIDGELPINVAYPKAKPVKSDYVLLSEGILKSYVIAQLSGYVTIGASGGCFASSRYQLEATLQSLQFDKLIICPDAGSLLNCHVRSNLLATVGILESLGYAQKILIADWGQLFAVKDKTDSKGCDYDELLHLYPETEVSLLSAKDFKSLVGSLSSLEFRYNEPLKSPFLHADLTIRERYLDSSHLINCQSKLIAVSSSMGTGKTESIKAIVRHYEDGNVISFRNSLLRNLCSRIPEVVFWRDVQLDDDNDNLRLVRSHEWVAACVDSIEKLPPKKVLVIEEAQKLVSHLLLGKTCKLRRKQIVDTLKRHCEYAERIYLFDADLTDLEVSFFEYLSGSSAYRLFNSWQSSPWQVHLYCGAYKSGKLIENERSYFLEQLVSSLQLGKKLLIVSDSQIWLEALEELLKGLLPDKVGNRVDSISKIEVDYDWFFDNPNDWIAEHNPDYTLLSPVCEASLDITVPHYDLVFGYFVGPLNLESVVQMLGRYRIPVPRHLFVRNVDRSAWLRKYSTAALGTYLSHIEKSASDCEVDYQSLLVDSLPYLETIWQLSERMILNAADLRCQVARKLTSLGHSVNIVISSSSWGLVKVMSEVKKSIAKARSQRIASSEDIPFEDALKIKRDPKSVKDLWAAEKAILKHVVPGLEITSDFVYWVRFEDPNILRKLKRRWYVQNGEFILKRLSKEFATIVDGKKVVWDVDFYELVKLRLCYESGILRYADRVLVIEEVDALFRTLKLRYPEYMNYLGYHRLSPLTAIRVLFSDLGFDVIVTPEHSLVISDSKSALKQQILDSYSRKELMMS